VNKTAASAAQLAKCILLQSNTCNTTEQYNKMAEVLMERNQFQAQKIQINLINNQ